MPGTLRDTLKRVAPDPEERGRWLGALAITFGLADRFLEVGPEEIETAMREIAAGARPLPRTTRRKRRR